MKGTPAHIARSNRKQKGPWAPPFQIGHEQNNRRLIAVEFLGATAEFTTYRVLNLKCGHESVITHKRFQEKRNQNGLCQSCARQAGAKRQKKQWYDKRDAGTSKDFDPSAASWLEIWREKKRVEFMDCVFFHNTWNKSLGIGA